MGLSKTGTPGRSRRDWAMRFAVALCATILAALLGPFTTYEQFTLVERFGYWGGLIFGALPLAFGIRVLTFGVLRGPVLVVDAIAAAIIAVLLGSAIWAFNLRVMGFAVAGLQPLLEHVVIGALICFSMVGFRAYVRAH